MISNSLPFFHPYISLFFFFFSFFFSLAFCPPHTYTHRIPSSLFFLYIPLDSKAFLSPYFSSSLILCSFFFFFFLFLLDSINSLALSVILDSIILLAFWCHYLQSSNTHRHTWRKEKSSLLHHTAITAPPPHCGVHATRGHIGFFFFFFFLIIYCCFNFFFLFLICYCCCFDFRFVV